MHMKFKKKSRLEIQLKTNKFNLTEYCELKKKNIYLP